MAGRPLRRARIAVNNPAAVEAQWWYQLNDSIGHLSDVIDDITALEARWKNDKLRSIVADLSVVRLRLLMFRQEKSITGEDIPVVGGRE